MVWVTRLVGFVAFLALAGAANAETSPRKPVFDAMGYHASIMQRTTLEYQYVIANKSLQWHQGPG